MPFRLVQAVQGTIPRSYTANECWHNADRQRQPNASTYPSHSKRPASDFRAHFLTARASVSEDALASTTCYAPRVFSSGVDSGSRRRRLVRARASEVATESTPRSRIPPPNTTTISDRSRLEKRSSGVSG